MPGQWLRPWLYDNGLEPGEPLLFPWGFGCLYNEVELQGGTANLEWERVDVPDEAGIMRPYINLIAACDILADEELCVARHKNGAENQLRDMLSISLRNLDGDRSSKHREKYYDEFLGTSSGAMHAVHPPEGVVLSSSPLHGNGVFATRQFTQGETIELAPSLLISGPRQIGQLFKDYEFSGPDPDISRLALGFGSCYNHDEKPNVLHAAATMADNAPRSCERYFAERDIDVGEELLVSYGSGWLQRCFG